MRSIAAGLRERVERQREEWCVQRPASLLQSELSRPTHLAGQNVGVCPRRGPGKGATLARPHTRRRLASSISRAPRTCEGSPTQSASMISTKARGRLREKIGRRRAIGAGTCRIGTDGSLFSSLTRSSRVIDSGPGRSKVPSAPRSSAAMIADTTSSRRTGASTCWPEPSIVTLAASLRNMVRAVGPGRSGDPMMWVQRNTVT